MLDTPRHLEKGKVSMPPIAPKNPEKRQVSHNLRGSHIQRTRGHTAGTTYQTHSLAQNNRPTVRELRPNTRSKRKAGVKSTHQTGPSKKKAAQGPQATCDLNPEGFFEVHVQYAQCKELATRFGVDPNDVIQTVQEDNQQRQTEHEIDRATTSGTQHEDDEDDRIPFRFDLSPGDELDDSDMEG